MLPSSAPVTVRSRARIESACVREGRNYDEIEKTTLGTLMMRNEGDERLKSPGEALELLRKFRDAGVDQAIFNMPFVDDPRTIELIAEKIIAPAAGW